MTAYFIHSGLECGNFLNTNISQGSVVTQLRCGGIINEDFVANLLVNLPVKEFWKSVNISQSYGRDYSGLFFIDSQCRMTAASHSERIWKQKLSSNWDGRPFGHSRHGPKSGGCCAPFGEGESWVPILHNVAWAEAYLHTKWHLDPSSRLVTIDMGRKLGLLCRFGWAGSPSITKLPGPMPT